MADSRASQFECVNDMHTIVYKIVAGRHSKILSVEHMVTYIHVCIHIYLHRDIALPAIQRTRWVLLRLVPIIGE